MPSDRLIESPVHVLSGSVRRRQTSPEAARALLHLRRTGLAVALMGLARLLPPLASDVIGGLAGTAAVVELVRAHLPHVVLPRPWAIAWIVCGGMTFLPGVSAAGQVIVGILSTTFFVLRRHRMLRVLSSRQRAVVLLGVVSVLVVAAFLPEPGRSQGALGEIFGNVHATAWWALIVGCVTTIAHLFLGIRLHFLRLRPKLAVAGLLLAAVPLVLLAALAVVLAFSVIGGSHSTHALATLEGWKEAMARDEMAGPHVVGPGFGDVGLVPDREQELVPAWRDELADAVAHVGFDPVPEVMWIRRGGEVWLVRTASEDGGRARLVGGRRLQQDSMQRLADQLECEVDLLGAGQDDELEITLGGSESMGIPIGEGEGRLRARPAGREEDGDGWFRRWIVFGGASFEVFDLEDGGLDRTNALISLRTRPVDLVDLMSGEANEVNRFVGIALLVLAVLFLLLEAFALYFGLRIVGGITGAVGHLHRATRRLAGGDLDARVDLPNEDEFGDLADGFNEMTRAIRVAQDQIVQKQLLEQEIAMARQIQVRLLPGSLPSLEGWELAGGSEPSKQVGGDYFDFLPLGDGRLGFAVGDVSGKGIPAALLMSNLQASLQGQARHDAPVTEVVERMNELLARSTDTHMFATFFYGVLDPTNGHVVGVNAGHEPPLIVRSSGELEELPAGGLILGMLPGQRYRSCETTLAPGDSLVLYTDGITEAMGPGTRIPGMEIPAEAGQPPTIDDDEDEEEIVTNFFGDERLREIVVARREESAESIRRAVLDGVARHVRDVPQSDDVTLLIIRRCSEVV